MKTHIIILAIFCSIQLSCAQQPMNYSIVRTEYIKGTYKTFSYTLRNDSILVTRFSTNDLPPNQLYSNILDASQKSRLAIILSDFNLPEMNDSYVNDQIDGEMYSTWDIRINNDSKFIYEYFSDEPHLNKLDQFIYEILPADQENWYEVY